MIAVPDFQTTIIFVAAGLACAVIAAGLFAWCWRGWLDLKRDAGSGTMGRIEVADLKERVRRLEAIAAGVDL
jgi:hypothetical protein